MSYQWGTLQAQGRVRSGVAAEGDGLGPLLNRACVIGWRLTTRITPQSHDSTPV